jgi:hypothetical protein
MTPVERCQFLYDYWKRQQKELYEDWKNAKANQDHWQNKLVEAEIAERLAKEHDMG